MKSKRPDWDEYFLKMTYLVAERSTCLRHHVGAVIVRDKKILTTGYNGAARGVKDCLELGCLRDEKSRYLKRQVWNIRRYPLRN